MSLYVALCKTSMAHFSFQPASKLRGFRTFGEGDEIVPRGSPGRGSG